MEDQPIAQAAAFLYFSITTSTNMTANSRGFYSFRILPACTVGIDDSQ
jgi:hypothetical protein